MHINVCSVRVQYRGCGICHNKERIYMNDANKFPEDIDLLSCSRIAIFLKDAGVDRRTRDEIHREIETIYLSHDCLAEMAYNLWLKDGKPDGERSVYSFWHGRFVKIRDLHWMMAESILKILASVDADHKYVALDASNSYYMDRTKNVVENCIRGTDLKS